MMEDALSFDGNTGPYVQYTYARTCSVLEKADADAAMTDVPLGEREMELAKALSRFPERVEAALAESEPSLITRYILELCAAYNGFYHDCTILSCEDAAVKASRVALTAATSRVLKTALHLICMQSPEKI
jgi:arginyl-tRNA synthetase